MNYVSSCLLILILAAGVNAAYAQCDSLHHVQDASLPPTEEEVVHSPYTRIILPAVFVTYQALSKVKLADRYVQNVAPRWRIKMDDYLQYAPAAAVYGLDFAGIKAKHNFRDRTFVMLSSYVFEVLSVRAIKYSFKVARPDGSTNNSFPSGHTATAFVGAHILFREYHEASPWIGLAGYTAATAVGLSRIVNNRHWLNDVAAGAGLGILCVEAGYLLLPVFRQMMGEGGLDIVIAPVVGKQMYGLGFACRF
ncbi:MAG: phosphatase PAP2 family protein [Tannerellaceae bacterium]|jgi:membrane-associated phospholipid phosphatase|nr:phosphatase PAP2 family protein [Tannerellaceae bacterium]